VTEREPVATLRSFASFASGIEAIEAAEKETAAVDTNLSFIAPPRVIETDADPPGVVLVTPIDRVVRFA
jgi:hypothetical protein